MKHWPLFLALLSTQTPTGSATPTAPQIAVDYEYSRHGLEICHGSRTVQSGESYLVCEASQNGVRTFVRLKVMAMGDRSYDVRLESEEVDANGHVSELSRPGIRTLDGEPASMRQSLVSPEGTQTSALEFKVTARSL